MPEVSVITTAYNAARHIGAAVDSVLAQRDVDVEHVIVDDGSTDDTVRVARTAGDRRVRLIEAGRIGRGRALNLAIAECRTDWIAVLDADDVAHPGRLRIELDVFRAHPEAALVGSGQLLIGEVGDVAWPPADVLKIAAVNRSLPIYNPLSHSSVMFRRAALVEVGGYDTGRSGLFDWDLYIRLAARGSALLKVSVPLVAKRIHGDQFFEGSAGTSYARQCLQLQWRSLADLDRSRWLAVSFPVIHAYRLAPRPARTAVRRAAGAARRFLMTRRPGSGS